MIDPQTWQSALSDLAARVVAYLPTVLLALVILAVGWALARLLAALARRLARGVGLDGVVERSGLAESLAQAKITRSASDLVALLIFWLVFLASLLLALETLVVPNIRLTEGTVRVCRDSLSERQSTNRHKSASHPVP